MYEMDGKMDNLVVLRASYVRLFSEGTVWAGEEAGRGASHC
jgi:hypothetical protein